MRRISGYAFLTDRESGKIIKEIDTVNCGHCSRICHPGRHDVPGDRFGHCNRCDRDICNACATKMEQGLVCDVWEEKYHRLEEAVQRAGAVSNYFR